MSGATSKMNHDIKVASMVSIAHGFSHFYQMILPPIFAILKIEFDVSFTALGLIITLMFAASGICQMISGFLVDRFGARQILLSGLALCGGATLAFSLVQSYEAMILLAVVVGIGLSVFHPADLSILTQKIDANRLGRAYAIHALCGNLGWAVAPPVVVGLTALFDWRTGVAIAGIIGLVYATLLLFFGKDLTSEPTEETGQNGSKVDSLAIDLRLLASAPIVLCFCYFTFFAMAIVGIQSFGALSLMELHSLSFVSATTALTAFLVASAVGVLLGGIIADRTPRHHILAMTGTLLASVFMFAVATVPVSGLTVMVLMIVSGFFLGLTTPSRDLIVRKVTPHNKTGRVFGFVYAGLDLGSLTMPVLLGWLLDRGDPKFVMLTVALFMLVAVPTVLQVRRSSDQSNYKETAGSS